MLLIISLPCLVASACVEPDAIEYAIREKWGADAPQYVKQLLILPFLGIAMLFSGGR